MNQDDVALAFWTRTAWSYPALSASNRYLLLGLANLANLAGNVTVVQAALADVMNVNTVTVRRSLRSCERKGWLAIQPGVDRRRGAREGLTYQLVSATATPTPVVDRVAQITDAVNAAKAKTIARINTQLARMSPDDVATLERLIGKR
jgi:MarR-like DNA-binding transcriptional regulator SgrR of sgrS sRNA